MSVDVEKSIDLYKFCLLYNWLNSCNEMRVLWFQGPSTSGVKPCSRCTPRNNPMDHPTIVDSVPGMLGVAYKLTLETRGDINADNYYMDCDVLPEDRSDCRIPDYSSIFPQPKPTSTESRRLPQTEENPFPAPSLFHHFRRLFRRLRRAAAL